MWGVNEPVVQGFVASLAHPGGNITGFTQVDFSIVGKSVEMLKLIAPALTHVALMYNPETYGFYKSSVRIPRCISSTNSTGQAT